MIITRLQQSGWKYIFHSGFFHLKKKYFPSSVAAHQPSVHNTFLWLEGRGPLVYTYIDLYRPFLTFWLDLVIFLTPNCVWYFQFVGWEEASLATQDDVNVIALCSSNLLHLLNNSWPRVPPFYHPEQTRLNRTNISYLPQADSVTQSLPTSLNLMRTKWEEFY